MQALDVLLKGRNMARLLQGLWVTLSLSLAAIALSVALGLLVGMLMTMKNRAVRAFCRLYSSKTKYPLFHRLLPEPLQCKRILPQVRE